MLSLECRKVQALMSLYIDDALSYNLKMFVYNHLQKCAICKKKYLDLKKTMQLIKSNFNKSAKLISPNPLFDVVQYEQFRENISAYFDGELNKTERSDFNNYINVNTFARAYFNTSVNINNQVKNFIKNNSPISDVDFSKKVMINLHKINYKNLFCIQDIFFLITFIALTFGLIFALENYFLPQNVTNYEKITLTKIKENILNINLKKIFNN